MSAMRAQAHVGSAAERESSVRAQKKMIMAIERQRTKNKLLIDHVQKQDQAIGDMQKKMREAQRQGNEDVPPPPPPKDKPAATGSLLDEESETERLTNQNIILHRELKLMASAWYDQNLRLASTSSAASGRGRAGHAGEPRGFLGRQRRRVDAMASGRTL